jgi:hypothetical protein
MAAKLTFEAKMNGLEKVIEHLTKAHEKLTDMGQHGTRAFETMDRRLKDFSSTIEYLNKQQSGLGGLSKMFDEITSKANSIAISSRNKIIKDLKEESTALTSIVKNIGKDIEQAQKDLNTLESRKRSMSAEDYLANKKMMSDEKARLTQEYLHVANERARTDKLVREQSPLFGQNIAAMGAKMGGPFGTILGATSAQALAAAPIMGAMIQAPIKGLELFGMASNAAVYDRTIQQINEYLAVRGLGQMTAEARHGDITTAVLRRYGVGPEATEGRSAETMRAAAVESILSQRMARLFTMGGGGAAAGAAFGSILPVFGTAIGAGIGAVGGGLYGFFGAEPQSMQQRMAARSASLARLGKEEYEMVMGAAGRNFREESQLTLIQQRMFGTRTSHENVSELMKQGVADLKDMAGFIGELNKFGKTLKNAEAAVFAERFGINRAASRAAFARSVAYGGEQYGMQQAQMLAARAGFIETTSMPAREILDEYAAAQSMQQGFGKLGVAGAGEYAAGLAGRLAEGNALGNMATTQVVAAQTAVDFAGRMSEVRGRTGTLGNTMIRMSLAKMGITNPIVQNMIVKMGVDKSNTIDAIVRATGGRYGREEVLEMLRSGYRTQVSAVNRIMGTKDMQQLQNMGLDPYSASMFGDVKMAQDISTLGGSGASMALAAAPFGVDNPPPAFAGGTQMVTPKIGKGFADEESGLRAREAATVEAAMQRLADAQGTAVTDIIRQAIVDGFVKAAQDISTAGKKATPFTPAENKEFVKGMTDFNPFVGTKAQKDSGR